MEILLSAPHLAGPGGVQTYMLAIAVQLERLGHGVWLWAEKQGEMAELARSRGLRVAGCSAELPARCDALLAQDGATALALAPRYPDAARAIVVHGTDFDLNLPPQLAGVVQAAVVMNDHTERRVRAAAVPLELLRLRQPIDHLQFKPVGAVREQVERVLLLGNYLDGARRDELVERCRLAGIAVDEVGRHGRPLLDPRPAIAAADVVIGQGRCLLEAMACGRGAYSFAPSCGDGWVTPGTYPAIEADAFRGSATGTALSPRDVVAELLRMPRGIGGAGRALVVAHHQAVAHVDALAALLGRLVPAPPPAASVAAELARAKRAEYAAAVALMDVQRDLHAAYRHAADLEAACAAWQDRATGAEADAAAARAHVELLKGTLRWRLAASVAKPLDRARAARRAARS